MDSFEGNDKNKKSDQLMLKFGNTPLQRTSSFHHCVLYDCKNPCEIVKIKDDFGSPSMLSIQHVRSVDIERIITDWQESGSDLCENNISLISPWLGKGSTSEVEMSVIGSDSNHSSMYADKVGCLYNFCTYSISLIRFCFY